MSASLRVRYSVGKFVLSEARTLVASYFNTVAALIEDFAVYTGVMYACMCVCVCVDYSTNCHGRCTSSHT